MNHDAELKHLLEKSIAQAAAQNPDPQTNPVDSLESYYSFIDFCIKALPWEINPSKEHVSLYDRIDQSMGCFYFVCDQPLEELQEKGYYHNSIMYHEPFRSWLIQFTSEWGAFLNTEASWKDEFYHNALSNPDFHLDGDLFEDHKNWKTFNDFSARKLSDPSKRPVYEEGNESYVIFPADSVPQGIRQIDENSRIVSGEITEDHGIAIKTGTLTDVSVLLKTSKYAHSFASGTLTHTFMDINDYHRYHFPVSGTVEEVLLIPQDDAPGGVIVWDEKQQHYKEYFSEVFGWQSIETRGAVIVKTESGAPCAIVPVGMCEVSSVNFESTVVPGAEVKKGDPLGYFLFGGSDIVMIFSKDAGFEMTVPAGEHIDACSQYGTIRP